MSIPRRFRLFLGAVAAVATVGVPLTLAVTPASAHTDDGGTITWTGNGTDNGLCGGQEDLGITVPTNEQAWLFILTQPGAGPWTITTQFSPAGDTSGSGTHEGNGSVHFIVFSPLGATLIAASAVTGTENSNLVVSGCQDGAAGPPTTPTSTPTTPTTNGTSTTPTTTQPATSPATPGGSTTTTSHPVTSPIAFTGANTGATAAAALLLIGLGTALMLVSRRRRPEQSS
jgi:hypothetical protein